MKHFLVSYKRSEGRLLELRDLGTDSVAAFKERARLEGAHRLDPDVEIVLLTAPSLEALERTHARYFKTVGELTKSLRGST
jgi:hypothetical protein